MVIASMHWTLTASHAQALHTVELAYLLLQTTRREKVPRQTTDMKSEVSGLWEHGLPVHRKMVTCHSGPASNHPYCLSPSDCEALLGLHWLYKCYL